MTANAVKEADISAEAVRGSWLFAAIYDPLLWWAERSGMSDRRHRLMAAARGSVLELGAGTGLNLTHYHKRLDRLVLLEPERHMAKRLERRIKRLGRPAEIVRATAETLPFDDETFDTVVSTLVLCTVEDPRRALDEIRCVLRPARRDLDAGRLDDGDIRGERVGSRCAERLATRDGGGGRGCRGRRQRGRDEGCGHDQAAESPDAPGASERMDVHQAESASR
jgi:SAM-dependent methyltransferase